MIWGLPQETALPALYRITVYTLVFLVALRMGRKHPLIAAACLVSVGSNLALLAGDLQLSGLLGVPWATMVAFIFLRYMWTDAESLSALLGAREASWAEERHDLKSELEAARGTVRYYQRTTGTQPVEDDDRMK